MSVLWRERGKAWGEGEAVELDGSKPIEGATYQSRQVLSLLQGKCEAVCEFRSLLHSVVQRSAAWASLGNMIEWQNWGQPTPTETESVLQVIGMHIKV